MHIEFTQGPGDAPHVCVVGVWEPPQSCYTQLFRAVASDAVRRSLGSLVLTLDPPPIALSSDQPWASYCDVRFRQTLQRESGITATAIAHLSRQDLKGGARRFLDTLFRSTAIEELWLGSQQTLGRYPIGSQEIISSVCRAADVRLRILPPVQMLRIRAEVERLLRSGRISDATNLASDPPTWHQPGSSDLRLAWAPGRYLVRPGLRAGPFLTPFEVELSKRGKLEELPTQDRHGPWLEFLAGPGDASAPGFDSRG